MSDREKIGVRVDAEIWNKFREDVEARKGQVRGVLGDELETAIREYLYGVSDTEKSIEDKLGRLENHVDSRLARVENEVGIVAPDGGAGTFDGEPHTHAPTEPSVNEKPAANAATDKKVEYLASALLEERETTREKLNATPQSELIDLVKDEYAFRSDTAKRYVNRLVEYFELVEHPNNSELYIDEEERNEIIESQREKRRDDADNKFGEIDNQ